MYEITDKNHLLLADGNHYIITPNATVRTIRELSDENWKSQLVHKYPNIPKGAEIRVYDINCNFYGKFLEVIYNGRIYNIQPCFVEYVKGANQQ